MFSRNACCFLGVEVMGELNHSFFFPSSFLVCLSGRPEMWYCNGMCAQRRLRSAWASAQPGHPPSLIRVFAARMKKAWVLSYPLSEQRRLRSDWADAQAKTPIRRGGCPNWSESSLGAHAILLVLSWGGSFNVGCRFGRVQWVLPFLKWDSNNFWEKKIR